MTETVRPQVGWAFLMRRIRLSLSSLKGKLEAMKGEAEKLRAEFFDQIDDPTVMERVFSSLPDVVFCVKNRERIYVSANDAFAERVGLGSRWEVVGKRADDLFPEALAALYRTQDEEVLSRNEGFDNRMELIPNRETGLGWYLATKLPVRGRNGRTIGLVSISRDLKVVSGGERGFAGLAKVVDRVEVSYGNKIERAELASLAGLSELQLERRVKRVFGLSVAGFVRKVRVEAGARMLAQTEMPLVEVATACGYAEQSAFTRQFKSAVGMPPGVYRREFGGWW
jgi:AraC-like DNA-binding protein